MSSSKINFKLLRTLLVLILIVFSIIYFLKIDTKDSTSPLNISKIQKEQVKMHFKAAIISDNISNCNNLIETNLIESCKLKLVDCTNDSCYFNKATFEMNNTLCYDIVNDSMRAECTATIKRSNLLEKAVLEDNVSVCLKFEDSANVVHCRDNYYIAKRYNMNNLSYCKYIQNEEIKNECFK